MVAAFGTGLVSKRDRRWHVDYPCLDRRTLMQSGALRPGARSEWVMKAGPGVATALSVELIAAPDGLTISTGGHQQVVHYWYDTILLRHHRQELRQFFRCPACERVCKRLYYAVGHWGCRTCHRLRYPIQSTPAGRILAVRQIEDLRRNLLRARPGSRRWKIFVAQITKEHAVLKRRWPNPA